MKNKIIFSICFLLVLIGASAFHKNLRRGSFSTDRRSNSTENNIASKYFGEDEEDEYEEGDEEGREKEEETDGPAEAVERDFQMTRDPETGRVPTERLYDAMDYYHQQQGRTNHKSTGMNLSFISWQERGASNIGGRTRAIMFDKNDATHKTVLAAGVGGGLWKCADITATTPAWAPVNDQFANLAITTIAQDPRSPQTMYFGTGEGYYNADAIKGGGIWKSTNGGANWSRLSSTTPSTTNDEFAFVQKIIVTDSGDVYAACRGDVSCIAGGLQKSTDDGSTWTRVLGSGSSCGTAIDYRMSDIEIAANGDLYASSGLFTAGKVYRSSKATNGINMGNSGTWTDITPSGSYRRIEITCAPSDSNQVYAVCQGGSSNDVTAIFSSSNKGSSWTSRTVPTIYDQWSNSVFTRAQAWYNLTAAVDPTDRQTIYIGGIDCLRSTDEGATWTQLTSWTLNGTPSSFTSAQEVHADMHSIVFRPGTATTAMIGGDGGLFYSSDLGSSLPSWTAKNNGYNVTQYYSATVHPTNSNYFLAGAQDNGTQQFTSPGLNAGTMATGGDGGFCYIDKTNGNNQISAYVYNNYYVSTDGGSTFSGLAGGDYSGRFINPGDLDGTNDILYTASGNNTLVRWSNVFGSSTRTNLSLAMGGTKATAIKVSPNTPSTVYLGDGAGNIFRVTNANATTPSISQIATSLGPSGNTSSIDVWKSTSGNDDSIVVTLSNYGINSVYITRNGTATTPTWTDIDDNSTLQDIPVRWAVFDPIDPKGIFIATEVGVLGTSLANGASTNWTLINNSSLPMVRTDMLRVTPGNKLIAATHGRGLFSSSTITTLPIDITTFDARKNGEEVALTWEVTGSTSTDHFTVERMYEGEPAFTTVSEVSARASTTYAATDQPAWNRGNIYYRLKCSSNDGTSSYSAIRKVISTSAAPTFISGVFPTVTSDELRITVGNWDGTNIEVFLTSMDGKVVMHQSIPYANAVLHLGAFPAGAYFLSLLDEKGGQKYVSRVVKQ